MADSKRDKLRQHSGVTPPGITDLMARLAAGAQPSSVELSAIEWIRQSPNALTIDIELTEDEWFLLIESIETIQKRYQWYLGDAMVYGVRRRYGETDDQIQRIVELTGKAPSTLHEYYKTALLFEIHERSENLDFEQHRVLAVEFSQDTPEHRAERLRWLHTAETQRLSGRKLKAEIAAAYLPAPAGVDTSPDEQLPSPALPEEEAVALPSPVTDEINKKRYLSVWRKVTHNALTTDDRQDVILIRLWCDQILNNMKHSGR